MLENNQITYLPTVRAAAPKSAFGLDTKVLIIARNTFREAVRDRVLYNLVLFVLLLIAGAILLGDLSDGQEARVIVNFGLSAMLVFGVFIAIFVGVGMVYKEIEKRTVFAMFAKPVRRGEFIVGKYLGLCLTLFVNTAIMGVGVSLALLYVKGATLALTIWWAIYLIFLELTVLTAVAIFFSSFSSPALSALFTFFVFLIGHFSTSLKDFAHSIGTPTAKTLFTTLYYILPNFSFFSFIKPAAHGLEPSFGQIGSATLYAAVYSLILITAAILVFSQRNFK